MHMLPAIPEDPQELVNWIDMFGTAYGEAFTSGLRFEPRASSRDALVFDAHTSTDAPLFVVPRPPTQRSFAQGVATRGAYAAWTKCFGPVINMLRTTGFAYQPSPTPYPFTFTFYEKPVVATTGNPSVAPFQDRYYVFTHEPHKDRLKCPVCLDHHGDTGVLFCDRGHWLCHGCAERVFEANDMRYEVDALDDDVITEKPPCPVCRAPATAYSVQELRVVRF